MATSLPPTLTRLVPALLCRNVGAKMGQVWSLTQSNGCSFFDWRYLCNQSNPRLSKVRKQRSTRTFMMERRHGRKYVQLTVVPSLIWNLKPFWFLNKKRNALVTLPGIGCQDDPSSTLLLIESSAVAVPELLMGTVVTPHSQSRDSAVWFIRSSQSTPAVLH